MMKIIREGGWPMLFILAFGLTSLLSAALLVARPTVERLRFIKGATLATVAATLVGVAADLAAVFKNVESRFADHPKVHLVVMLGLAEAMAPVIVGMMLVALTCMVAAVGASRIPRDLR